MKATRRCERTQSQRNEAPDIEVFIANSLQESHRSKLNNACLSVYFVSRSQARDPAQTRTRRATSLRHSAPAFARSQPDRDHHLDLRPGDSRILDPTSQLPPESDLAADIRGRIDPDEHGSDITRRTERKREQKEGEEEEEENSRIIRQVKRAKERERCVSREDQVQ